MISEKQLEANRQNAQKSTGPKTPIGKAVAAQNSTTHGLTANTPVIAGEDPADYAQFRSQLRDEMNPKGPMETMLSDRIIELAWRLKRTGRLQSGTFDTFAAEQQERGGASRPNASALGNTLGRIAINDFSNGKVLDRLLMHERRIEQSLYKSMLELQRLQFIRTKYQSLLMDHADYDDCEIREITESLKAAGQ